MARHAQERDQLVGARDAVQAVDSTAAHRRRALRPAPAGRSPSAGTQAPRPLASRCCEALGAIVLHDDADFDLIGAVTGQRCQWVVPVGSTP